ncbi:MAG: UDP-N-acetylmuramate dehydrogenase [Chlamydiia bacterium]|nr:UDP-N-acetylmuramate dehydrogenase [Chlamydiia bacterium]
MIPFSYQKNKPLCEVSSFKIGGPARYFAEAKEVDILQQMIVFCALSSIPYFILGKGSNVLFDDRGYNGLVIHNRIETLGIDENRFVVGAGYSFSRLGKLTTRLGWTGLEFASGIPATVGGAVCMNAGANGQETKDRLVSVEYITAKGERTTVKKEDIIFSYRTSPFQKWRGAIALATFTLEKGILVKDTQRRLLTYRLKTQPYKDPSAGCAFRNPSGQSAGALIERCGLKGCTLGGAEVSRLHANFIVNKKGATAQDIINLIDHVKTIVFAQTGIQLQEEIIRVPYE